MSIDGRHAQPVAVLMCAYHGDSPDLFARAIDSILNQDYKGEKRIYLCVDGPVSSQMMEVVALRRARIFYLFHSTQNNGLAASLNLLIQALGDESYVFRMDADDYALPERFIETIQFMDSEGLDVCGSWIAEVSPGRSLSKIVKYPRDHKKCISAIAVGSPVAHPTVCFRRSVFIRCPQYPLKRSNEDIAFWFALMGENLRFGNVQKVLLEFTVSDGFFQRRSRAKASEELIVYLRGLYRLHGLSFVMLAPFLRFFVRQMPTPLIRCAYAARWLIGR